MSNKPHPHAEILRAIADGVPLSQFELVWKSSEPGSYWLPLNDAGWILNPTNWLVRRKQRTHVVNGFTVPAPMDKEPTIGEQYYALSMHSCDYYTSISWANFPCEKMWIKRGLCFTTKEAAIANSKAMLNIDPEEV